MIEATLVATATTVLGSYLSYRIGFKRGKDLGYHLGFTNGLFKGNEQAHRNRKHESPKRFNNEPKRVAGDPVWLG